MRSLPVILLIVLVAVFGTDARAKVQESGDLTRKIHGSYGPYRDFTADDCSLSYETSYSNCKPAENNAFIYHWNNKLKACERKIYKGCGATRNNFLTERDCNAQAKPVCSK